MKRDYVIAPTKGGFSVHVAGCPACKGNRSIPVPAAELDEQVADARERGHNVRICPCAATNGH